eukprot:scaffold620_cov282-Pinguiococcus_pyrenoidosus.AAC.16
MALTINESQVLCTTEGGKACCGAQMGGICRTATGSRASTNQTDGSFPSRLDALGIDPARYYGCPDGFMFRTQHFLGRERTSRTPYDAQPVSLAYCMLPARDVKKSSDDPRRV